MLISFTKSNWTKAFRHAISLINVGLLYTLHYLDFSSESWKLISNNPTIFETMIENAVLEIRDISHKEHKLVFKKGGKIEYMRSVGKYRLKWNDEDLLN